jgi:bifunctional UDP-N-acetylglucosamine pyrophosphorylase/glucosamine-1-phosphate N-acetyltransferase
MVRIGNKKVNTGLVKFGAIIGDNCKTGINAGIMPGVKVGPDSIIGPHVCMIQDLEADSMVVAEAPQNVIKKRMHREKKHSSKPTGGELCVG